MDKIFSRNVVGSISILWIVFIFCLLILKRGSLVDLDLNEIGDFLAGVFAPLGFFWLVAGFYQQGKGLEQNSTALKLQAIELEKTTQALELQVQEMKLALVQQTALSETTKQDLELSKQAFEHQIKTQHINMQPFFHITAHDLNNAGENIPFIFEFSNSRTVCREVGIYCKCDGQNYSNLGQYDLVKTEVDKTYHSSTWKLPKNLIIFEDDSFGVKVIGDLKISYLNALDNPQEQYFQLVIKKCKDSLSNYYYVQKPSTRSIGASGF